MASRVVEWRLKVPSRLNRDVRNFLRDEGKDPTDTELGRFVESAVGKALFDGIRQRICNATAHIPYEEIEAIIEESLAWARARMEKKKARRLG